MRSTQQSGSSYQRNTQDQTSSYSFQSKQVSSGGADFSAEKDFFLKYASIGDGETVVSGSSDYGLLLGLRDAILKLRSDFFSTSGAITIKSN